LKRRSEHIVVENLNDYSIITMKQEIYLPIKHYTVQGRINQYANYAMAWGPPVQGAPFGGTNFLIFKFQ